MMKRMIFLCGANGVGKSTVSRELSKNIKKSVYIDSEYCCSINPFEFNTETIQLITLNITALIINSFRCDYIQTVIFPYGFHGPRKQIFDDVLDELRRNDINYEFHPILLECETNENIQRMRSDNRDEQRIERAINNTRHKYNQYDYPRLNTTHLTVEETVNEILKLLNR